MENSQKPKLVVMLSRFPYPLEKGDKLRAFHQIIEMSKTFSVRLLCISEVPVEEFHLNEVKKYCDSVDVYRLPAWKSWLNAARMLLGRKPLQVAYFYSSAIHRKINKVLISNPPDHIFCQLVRASEYVKNYHDCPKTIDYMDAFSKGVERRIQLVPFYKKWLFRLESKRLSLYERSIYDYFEGHTIISEQDANLLGTSPNQRVTCVPNGVADSFLNYQSEITPKYDIVFVGNLNYPPNVEAVKYIVKEILPFGAQKGKNWQFLAAGAEPSKELISLMEKSPNTFLQGDLKDIRIAYISGKVFVAPMKIGTGLQNKLLEAMALSLPCVTTKLANNALHAKNKEEILIADSTEEFVLSISNLIDNYESQTIGKAARKMIEANFTWDKCTELLIAKLKKNTKILKAS